jgi:hypothetical protein
MFHNQYAVGGNQPAPQAVVLALLSTGVMTFALHSKNIAVQRLIALTERYSRLYYCP